MGALVLVNPFRFSTGHAAALGNTLILVNGLCYALFLVLQRPILTRIPWRTVIAASFFFGAIGILPVAVPALWPSIPPRSGPATGSAWPTSSSSPPSSPTPPAPGGPPFLPALVAAYSTLQPLVASALAAAFLGEHFGWEEGIGFALIAAGLWLVSGRAQNLQPQETPRRRR